MSYKNETLAYKDKAKKNYNKEIIMYRNHRSLISEIIISSFSN